MSVSTTVYETYLHALATSAAPDLSTATFKCALLTSSYTPNYVTHDFFDDVSTFEVAAGGGYTAGGETLITVSLNDNDVSRFVYLDAADVVFNFVGFAGNFRYAVLYVSTGTPSTSRLLFLIDLGSNVAPASTIFRIRWPAVELGSVLKFGQG